MGDSDSDYEFGSGDDELARLEVQGSGLAPATRMIFAAAGIRARMRVLDLGCGAGDVALVAADLVGPDGHVVGVDRSPDALGRPRLRAEQRGLAQVEFVEGDIHDPAPGEPFDAIVGRLILMYVPDPAAVLRRQATVLRAGGLVVPIEFDIPAARALPATPLASQALAWVVEAFAKGGIQPALGRRLWAILREATASARDARDPAALWTRRSQRYHWRPSRGDSDRCAADRAHWRGHRPGDRRGNVRATAERRAANEPGGLCLSHAAQCVGHDRGVPHRSLITGCGPLRQELTASRRNRLHDHG
jgi:SAM-dependent methyltransferase